MTRVAFETTQGQPQRVTELSPLPVAAVGVSQGGIPKYDTQVLTYNGNGDVATITYKRGGASGTTVAVQTLTYNGSFQLTTNEVVVS